MPGTFRFNILGVPAPQGSKKGYIVNGRVNMVESSAAVKPWREAVAEAVSGFDIPPAAPVYVELEFRFTKPRTSKLAFPGRRQGDLDKLARSTNDGLVMSGCLPDDSQIYATHLSKRWTYPDEPAGAYILIAF